MLQGSLLGFGAELLLAISVCLSGTIIILCNILLRMKSLETAVELLESADIQIGLISDQNKEISQKPLNIRNFAIADPKNLHEQLKVHYPSNSSSCLQMFFTPHNQLIGQLTQLLLFFLNIQLVHIFLI